MASLASMAAPNIADIAGNVSNLPVGKPAVDPELYEKISQEVANVICKGIYTNKKDGTNMSENINKILTQKIIDSLNNDEINQKIQDMIFGNDDEKHAKGLRKYIQDLIRVCDGGNKNEIYAFTGRVLQTLFNTQDKEIDNLFESESIKPLLYNGTYSDTDVMDMLKKEILEQLKGTLKISNTPPVANTAQPVANTAQSVENTAQPLENTAQPVANIEQPVVKTGGTNDTVPTSIETTQAMCQRIQKETPIPPESIQLNEVSTPPTTLVNDLLQSSNEIQTHIVGEIKTSINNEKIEYIVNQAVEKIIKSVLGNITTAISDVVITKYTDAIIKNKTMKLQLLYSILSYDEKSNVDEYGVMRDNTLFVAKELFTNALSKKRSEEGRGQRIVEILNKSLTDEIAKRGGDTLGRSVSALNSLTNIKITGGKKRRTRKKMKSKKNYSLLRKRSTGK